MSKLSFRARALDASKPMPIYLAEDLPDLPEYSAINRAVPQMPSGMEKEEECEHHLQRAICTGLIIPTPEVSETADLEFYQKNYPADYKMPRQLIHMQPLCLEQEVPEYDIDSEDERWLKQQRHAELTELKFEEMMDKLEKSSGQTVVTLNEAKLLLGRQDDLVVAVYDYWLNKRLKTQHPLILSVRTEQRPGQPANNPYLAFRRRTEKMQTRKNRKNDESSYEKMLKLRRELERAASLLQLVAKREQAKRDLVRITAAVNQTRLKARDYTGHLCAELTPQTVAPPPPIVPAPLLALNAYRRDTYNVPPHYADPPLRQREKRQYKRRKHRHHSASVNANIVKAETAQYSTSESESGNVTRTATPHDDGPFAFRRKHGVYYQMPTSNNDGGYENPLEKNRRYRFTLTSMTSPRPRCVGFARRRLGRGGRILFDRLATPLDDLWTRLPHTFKKSTTFNSDQRFSEEQLNSWHGEPIAAKRDFTSDSKHPWRKAFRNHLQRNPDLWTSDNKNSDSKNSVNNVLNSDISVSDLKRKRSDSLNSEDSLTNEEVCFEDFVQEMNSEWLHFRPKTPPPAAEKDPVSPDKTLFNRNSPVNVELRLGMQFDDGPPSQTLLKDTSPFTTGFTLSDIFPEDSIQEDLTDSFGLTDGLQVLSDADLKVLTEEVKDGKKNDLAELTDAILEELSVTEGDSFLCRGAGERPIGPAPNRIPPPFTNADLGSTAIRVMDSPYDPIYIDNVPEEKPPPAPVLPPSKPASQIVKVVPASAVRTQQLFATATVPLVRKPIEELVKMERKSEVVIPSQTLHQVPMVLKPSNIVASTSNMHTTTGPSTSASHVVTGTQIATSGTQIVSAGTQIVTSGARKPQVLTVAVSEALKVRLQSHLLAGLDAPAVVGLVQNGPYAVSTDGVSNATNVTRRANVATVAPGTTRAVKLVQRLPAVMSYSGAGGNTRPQYIEIKGGQLSKGTALVNVVRHHSPQQARQPIATAPRAARLALAMPRPNIQLHPTAALPGSVVAELLQKNAAGRGGARLALSSGAPAVHALYAARRRPANTETTNSTTPGSAEASGGGGNGDGGDVRRLEVT